VVVRTSKQNAKCVLGLAWLGSAWLRRKMHNRQGDEEPPFVRKFARFALSSL
jgi:hypothetical protein